MYKASFTRANDIITLAVEHERVTGTWGVRIIVTDAYAKVVRHSFVLGAWESEADAVGIFEAGVKGFDERGYRRV